MDKMDTYLCTQVPALGGRSQGGCRSRTTSTHSTYPDTYPSHGEVPHGNNPKHVRTSATPLFLCLPLPLSLPPPSPQDDLSDSSTESIPHGDARLTRCAALCCAVLCRAVPCCAVLWTLALEARSFSPAHPADWMEDRSSGLPKILLRRKDTSFVEGTARCQGYLTSNPPLPAAGRSCHSRRRGAAVARWQQCSRLGRLSHSSPVSCSFLAALATRIRRPTVSISSLLFVAGTSGPIGVARRNSPHWRVVVVVGGVGR